MKVRQAYRFALDPTPAQELALRSHAGAARFAWNWALGNCRERYAAERKWYSDAELHKLWNQAKKADPALAWWDQNSKCAYQESFRNLDRALRDFAKSRKGQRKGRRLGFPRFKKKGKCRDSFRLTGTLRCGEGTVILPRLGTVRTHEPTRKLARRLADGSARILSATVSRTAQRWHVSFTVEADRDVPARHARPRTAIGIDLGVKALITGADDAGAVITVPGPRPYKTRWNGGALVIADRWYPSSKTCSGCGTVKAKLGLSERTYRCDACGLVTGWDASANKRSRWSPGRTRGSGTRSRPAWAPSAGASAPAPGTSCAGKQYAAHLGASTCGGCCAVQLS